MPIYKYFRVWCDEEDCTTKEEQMAETKQQFIDMMRDWGWAIHSGEAYCQEHNQK